jgi:hypothetical protein
MAERENLPVPKKSAMDVVHAVAKVGLSAIPQYGGVAAELFGAVLPPPLEKRRQDWYESVGQRRCAEPAERSRDYGHGHK